MEVVEEKQYGIADSDKRAFLKLIGFAGVSFFLYSIFSRRSGVPLLNGDAGPKVTGPEDTAGKKIHPAETHPTDGYRIAEIDDDAISYYGFTNKDGGWIIMREDTDTTSFRYTKGDTGFPDSWSNRERLKYDYYYNVF